MSDHEQLPDELARRLDQDAAIYDARDEDDGLPPVIRDEPIKPRPGSMWAAAAFRAGREDEYIDAMKNRYGGQW